MEERLKLQLDQLSEAIADFECSLDIDTGTLDEVVADAVRAGQAQKFEFVVGLFWKTAKAFLDRIHGFDLASPKPIIKKYFELGNLDYAALDRMLRAFEIRNSLSHVYRKETFQTLHAEILGYRGVFSQTAKGMMETA